MLFNLKLAYSLDTQEIINNPSQELREKSEHTMQTQICCVLLNQEATDRKVENICDLYI